MRNKVRRGTIVLTAIVSICVAGAVGMRPGVSSATVAAPVLLPGFQATLFASGNASYSNPDSVEPDLKAGYIYVGYQNVTAKDGTDNKTSTIVQYSLSGTVLRTFTMPGHNDGLRVDPQTHMLWATSNEDGNPVLMRFDPRTGEGTSFDILTLPHGGGLDDMAFINGQMYVAFSNPTLDSAGANSFPALVRVITVGGRGFSYAPVVNGSDTALDTTTNQSVTLNEVDPDSLTVTPQGDLMLVNQGGSELVFVHNPGAPNQSLTRVPVGTQLDDTVWATSAGGRLLVVDGKTNSIWQITGPFTPGTVYTQAPDDSGVASFLGTVNLTTGTVTPVGIGFVKPTGMAFIPGA